MPEGRQGRARLTPRRFREGRPHHGGAALRMSGVRPDKDRPYHRRRVPDGVGLAAIGLDAGARCGAGPTAEPGPQPSQAGTGPLSG
ncbi:hypothetical protein ACFPM0_15690 [Pseudonocardia sulfidoxydans]|uniref:hypothetical protein n=1 Tax=Pseudonocardia sulfidoxydans TaxID=54011 RepID=UPI00361B5555